MPMSSLISYAKRDIFETIPGLQRATFDLPASMENIPTIIHVDDSHYFKPDIDGHQDRVFVPSEQIVKSVVHMHITSQLLYKVDQHPALFCIPNIAVSLEDLKQYGDLVLGAIEKQRRWYVALVQLADDDWQLVHRHNVISDIQRTAARELGLTRDWLIEIQDETGKGSCPFCGTGLLNSDAPICPTCGKVHNPTRMAELELLYGAEEIGVEVNTKELKNENKLKTKV
jgi:hypothetical protein